MPEAMTCAEAAVAVNQYPEYQACIDVGRETVYVTHGPGLDWGPGVETPDVLVTFALALARGDQMTDLKLDVDQARLLASALIGMDIEALIERKEAADAKPK